MLENITNLINKTLDLLGGGVSNIFMTLAFLAFLWAVINFIWVRRKGDANGLQQATQMLWWSVVGLAVMVSVWGIVNFLATNILGTDASKTNINRPQTKFGGTSSGSSDGSTSGNSTSGSAPTNNRSTSGGTGSSGSVSGSTDSSCANGALYDSSGKPCPQK